MTLCMGWTSGLGQGQESPVSPYVKDMLCGDLESGARIRFRINQDLDRESNGDQVGGKTITGTLQSCGDGMLVFKPEKSNSDLEHVSLDDVLWLQVSQGRSSYALPGALVGLAAGIAISMASQTHRHEDEFLGGLSDATENVSRGIGITAATTLLGVFIGYVAGSENWESVYGENVSASLSSNRLGEFQLSVGYSF